MKGHKIKKLIIAVSAVSAMCTAVVYMVYAGYLIPNKLLIGKRAVIGCDVSHYQGKIDWDTLYQQNVKFAFIKATEGSGYVDNRFQENWRTVYTSKVKGGAYHFFSFDSPGESQARLFIKTVGKRTGMLPPVVDVEFYGNNYEERPDAASVRAELDTFLSIIETEYKTKPIIYTTRASYKYFLKGHYKDYPLWFRNVLTPPLIGRDWLFWQYTNREELEGYSGAEKYIDLNVFHGNEAALENLLLKDP